MEQNETASLDATLSLMLPSAQNRRQMNVDLRRQVFWDAVPHTCVNCGENDPLLIDFHHIGPKHFAISTALNRAVYAPYSQWPLLLHAELQNVVPLCVVCHRKYHGGLITLPADVCGIVIDKGWIERFQKAIVQNSEGVRVC